MPTLRQQIREYYDSLGLSEAKVEAILHANPEGAPGEGGTSGRKIISMWRRPQAMALAAGFLLLAGLATWFVTFNTSRVPFAALAPRIVEFFGTPPELPLVSQDKAALRAWLIARGAPQDMRVPEKLLPLESLGCQVVDMHGRPAYLACFWRENRSDRTGADLIHLFTMRRSDIRDGPGPEPQMKELSGWSFASWAEGDAIYTLATAAPMKKLRPFVSRDRSESTRLAALRVSF